jgi:WD40 repeat protein
MLKGHEDRLWSLAFAPDGTRLASSSDDNTLRIWGIPTGEPLLTLRGYERAVDTIVFSRDSRSLVTVDFSGRVRPWGLSNAERLQMARENQTPR